MLMSIQHLHALHLTSSHLKLQASSVPCERLFSGTKQVATDRRASLGNMVFEEVTITKSAWGPGLCDVAAWNAAQIEEVAHFRAIHKCTRTCTCEYFNSQTGTRTRANSFPRVTRTRESSTHELQVHPPSCKYLRVPAGTHRYSQVLRGHYVFLDLIHKLNV